MSDYETNLARIKAESDARIAKMIEEGVSDTPETDAAWIKSAKMDGVDSECFLRNLATKLERDLSAAKALMIEMIAQKNVELWQLRKQRDGLREALEESLPVLEMLIPESHGIHPNPMFEHVEKVRAALAKTERGNQ
jgi:hypothetical protein